MNRFSLLNLAIVAIAGVVSAAPARAGFTVFFGVDPGNVSNANTTRPASTPNATAAQNNFLGNVTGAATESFEGIAPGSYGSLGLTFPGFGAATLTGVGGNFNVNDIPTGTNGQGRFPTAGNRYVDTSNDLLLTFATPVAAFGFKGIDFGDVGGQLTLTLAGGGTQSFVVPNSPTRTNGSVLFFGLIGTGGSTFTSVTFDKAGSNDGFGYDELTVASPVPAPPAVGLALLGMMSAGGLRFARRWLTATA